MPSQFGSTAEAFRKVVDNLDKGMSRKFERCKVCKVPLHKDGHEVPRWCWEDTCPHTGRRTTVLTNAEQKGMGNG